MIRCSLTVVRGVVFSESGKLPSAYKKKQTTKEYETPYVNDGKQRRPGMMRKMHRSPEGAPENSHQPSVCRNLLRSSREHWKPTQAGGGLAYFSASLGDYSYAVKLPRTDVLGYSQASLRDFRCFSAVREACTLPNCKGRKG
jgi:hypothetical protein